MATAGDLDQLIQTVFGQGPLPPHAIQLELDSSHATPRDVFRTLGQLLTHGIVFLYGEEAAGLDVTILQQYMASVGWRAIVNPRCHADHPQALPYVLVIPTGTPGSTIRVAFEPYR